MARASMAVVCAAVLVLSACGGSGDEPADASPPAGPDPFFGVAPQAPLSPDDLARMAEGGVGTVRIFLPWGAIDPTHEDDYTFGDIDPAVLDAARNGIEVQPFLYGTPAWVAQAYDGVECEADCAAYAPRSREALAAWAEFAAATVDRYGPGGELWKENPDVPAMPVGVWQIWNEQNSPTFYLPQPDVASFAEVLSTAAEAIRDRDPEAEILLGGMFGTPLGGEAPGIAAQEYLRELYEIEGTDGAFDAVAAHPYAAHQQKVESQVELLREEMVRAGDGDAELWVTELGWASSGPDVPLNRGPEGQAKALDEAYRYFLEKREEWNIEAVVWYSWRDTSVDICDWCGGSGLFPEDSLEEPKPAWDAFTALTGGT